MTTAVVLARRMMQLATSNLLIPSRMLFGRGPRGPSTTILTLLWYIKLRFFKKATKIWRSCGLFRIYKVVDGFWKRHKIRKESLIYFYAFTTTDVKNYGIYIYRILWPSQKTSTLKVCRDAGISRTMGKTVV